MDVDAHHKDIKCKRDGKTLCPPSGCSRSDGGCALLSSHSACASGQDINRNGADAFMPLGRGAQFPMAHGYPSITFRGAVVK